MHKDKDGTIKTNWVGWDNKDKCPLCGSEGKDIANIWKKGHNRRHGIILETGLSYCEKCFVTPECEEHWKKWWAEQWQKQEEQCEENWEKYGVYTNVGGYYGVPSFHFGYAKTEEGLKPYLQVYPDCPRYKLEREVFKIRNQYEKIGSNECLNKIKELVQDANVDADYKINIIKGVNDFLNSMEEWKKEQKPCLYCGEPAFTYYCKKIWYPQPNENGETFAAVCQMCDKNKPLNDGRR